MDARIELAEQLAEKAGRLRKESFDDWSELRARILEDTALELLKQAEADPQTVKQILSLAGERKPYSFASKKPRDSLTVGGFVNGAWEVV